jgi:hypothetical protein
VTTAISMPPTVSIGVGIGREVQKKQAPIGAGVKAKNIAYPTCQEHVCRTQRASCTAQFIHDISCSLAAKKADPPRFGEFT